MSRNDIAGRDCSIACRAATPSPTSPTIARSGQTSANASRSSRRSSGSSSAMIAEYSGMRYDGNRNCRSGTRGRRGRELKRPVCPVETREPLARILQADARCAAGRESDAVVDHAHHDPLTILQHAYSHSTTTTVRLDAVSHGVFDESLQQQWRKRHAPQFVLNICAETQTVAEPDLHDGEIALDEGDLLTERRVRRTRALECALQEVREVIEHVRCGAVVRLDEVAEVWERIHEEVGLDLCREGLELRF